MLAIRLQRTGRSGHSQFRLVAQDSRFSPKRGRIVAYLGSYNPHTKEVNVDAEKVSKYLENGARPSDSAARLLKKEGVKLPAWYSASQSKERSVRNPEKRRSTRPAEPETTVPADESGPDVTPDGAETEPAAEAAAKPETPAAESPASEEAPAEPAKDSAAADTAAEPADKADTPADNS